MRERRLFAGALGVVLLALALRLGPLYWSPLPFNTDGFVYAASARDVLALDSLPLERMATDQIGYTALLAMIAALAGEAPLSIAQPMSAAIGSASVLLVVALTHRLARDAGVRARRATVAALLAGLLLSLEGVYLYRSMATDEQTAGLLLVPAVVLALAHWLSTGRRAWGVLASALLLPIPPTHNLTGLVAAVAVTVLCGWAIVARRSLSRGPVIAPLLTWAYVLGYHAAMEAFTPATIVQAERLVRVPGLFVSWIVLAVVGVAWYRTTSGRFRRRTVVGVVAVGFGLVALNAVRTVFPGTTATPSGLLLGLLPLALLGLFAGLAAHHAVDSDVYGGALVALVAAALAVVGTGLTAGLTFDYLALLWRSQLFAHLPLLALAALGTILVARRVGDRRGAAIAVVVVLAAAVTAPIAFAGLDQLPFTGVTTEAEFAATGHAAERFATWTTDDHLVRVAGYHGANVSDGPIYRWLRLDGAAPACPTLARPSWTGVGAQVYPQDPATLSPSRYDEWLAGNDVVYATDTSDSLSLVIPRGDETAGC